MATIRQKLSTYAITILTHQRRRHFQRTANAELFIATLFRYQDQGKFALHAFAIMPDHVHVLITPAIDQSTSRCIQLIKGGYSFAVREQSPGEIWHSGYHEHRVRDESDFNAQKQSIANNPSRKQLPDYPHVHTSIVHCLTSWTVAFRSPPHGLKPASFSPRTAKAEALAYLEAPGRSPDHGRMARSVTRAEHSRVYTDHRCATPRPRRFFHQQPGAFL